MSNIWIATGNWAASEWGTRWDAARRDAGLSIERPDSYTKLIHRARTIASEIAELLEDKGSSAIAACAQADTLADPNASALQVVQPLQANARNAIMKVALDRELRVPNDFRTKNLATIEAEAIDRHLFAIRDRLCEAIKQRYAVCVRGDKDFSFREKQDIRTAQKHLLDMVTGWGTLVSGAFSILTFVVPMIAQSRIVAVVITAITGTSWIVGRLIRAGSQA